jgi:hypothetical protein
MKGVRDRLASSWKESGSLGKCVRSSRKMGGICSIVHGDSVEALHRLPVWKGSEEQAELTSFRVELGGGLADMKARVVGNLIKWIEQVGVRLGKKAREDAPACGG